MTDSCIFCKIVAGEIPSKKVYEDTDFLAFHDINPSAPVHVLLIPKVHVVDLQQAAVSADLLGRMLALAPKIATDLGCGVVGDWGKSQGGFRVMINNGPDGGQEVGHLHLHIMGGKRPWKKG
jgi:histidine triad (HIT) family protein